MSKKKSKSPLGITSRTGPRTGHTEIDWTVSEAIAETFLDHFDTHCTDNRIKPNYEPIIGGTAVIADPSTGQPVPVTVGMEIGEQGFVDIEVANQGSLPVSGYFYPENNLIVISPTLGTCKTRESWKNILLSAIRHELTHAADPGFYKSNKKLLEWIHRFEKFLSVGKGTPPSLKDLPRSLRKLAKKAAQLRIYGKTDQVIARKSGCEYITSNVERRAFLTQVGSEIKVVGERLIKAKDKGFKSPEAAMKALSPTFREISKCLVNKKDKDPYLKVAARLWDLGYIPKSK